MNRSFTRSLLVFFTFCFLPFTLTAQYFKWVRGGGSDGAIQNKDEQVTHICTDDNGNVYILAQVGDNNIKADSFFMASAHNVGPLGVQHTLFASYTCDGNMRFAKLLEAKNNGVPTGVSYSNGKIYVSVILIGNNKRIGYDAAPASQYHSVSLSKFDTSGAYLWTRFAGQDILLAQTAVRGYGALSVDGQGNIHQYNYFTSGLQLTPSVTTQTGNYDLKYDVNGTILSATKLQFADTAYYIKKVEIDKANNNAYALFEIGGGSITRPTHYISAFNSSGTSLWHDSTNVRGGIANFRLRPGDGIYVAAGSTANYTFSLGGLSAANSWTTTGMLGAVVKLKISDGKATWIKKAEGTSTLLAFTDIEIMPDYTMMLITAFRKEFRYNADTFTSPTGISTNMLIRMDTAGNILNTDKLNLDNSNKGPIYTTSDKRGNFYMGGYLTMSIGAPGITPYTTNGSSDFFVMKYGVECYCTPADAPASNFTHAAGSAPKQIQFTYSGTGGSADSVVWDFGDGTAKVKQNNPSHTYTSGGTYTVCATAYNECGINKQCKLVQVTTGINDVSLDNISIYPNPVTDWLTIEGAAAGTTIILYDITGRQLQTITTTTNKTELNTAGLPAGNYMIQLTGTDGSRRIMKLQKQ